MKNILDIVSKACMKYMFILRPLKRKSVAAFSQYMYKTNMQILRLDLAFFGNKRPHEYISFSDQQMSTKMPLHAIDWTCNQSEEQNM